MTGNGGLSHRQVFVALLALVVASGTASRWVAALQPTTLLPWVGLIALPVAWTFRRPRTVDLFEPFTFLSWTHYLPAFVIGSTLLATGVVLYPYPSIVADPTGATALTLAYVGMAYVALSLGTRWQGARALGTRVGRMLPAPRTDRTVPLLAILALIALGMAANYGAFRAGIIGFAVPRAPRPLDAAVSYAGLFMTLGYFLFWFRWFAPDQKRLPRIALVVPVVVILSTMVLLGNRGALLIQYLVAALAFRFARGRLTLRQSIVAVTLAFVALGVGMVYGSVFRHLRGGESGSPEAAAVDAAATQAAPAATAAPPPPAVTPTVPVVAPAPSATASAPAAPAPAIPPPGEPVPSPAVTTAPAPAVTAVPAPAITPRPTPAPAVTPTPVAPAAPAPPSLERHLEVAAETANTLIRNPLAAPLNRVLEGVGQRLNLVSDASVTIARYPTLRPLEPQYGIVNMWTMTWTGVVPRALWPGKPKVSDARAYSSLYFGHDKNSYATTPPVDLIRNVGPYGMPVGMAVLGAVLGVMAAALLLPTSPGRAERGAFFSLVLLNINLEGSFGLILPTMFRVGIIVIAGLALVRLLTVLLGSRRYQHD